MAEIIEIMEIISGVKYVKNKITGMYEEIIKTNKVYVNEKGRIFYLYPQEIQDYEDFKDKINDRLSIKISQK